jgi:hypothetical protein
MASRPDLLIPKFPLVRRRLHGPLRQLGHAGDEEMSHGNWTPVVQQLVRYSTVLSPLTTLIFWLKVSLCVVRFDSVSEQEMHDVILGSFCYDSLVFGVVTAQLTAIREVCCWQRDHFCLVLSSGWFMLVYPCLNVCTYIFYLIWFIGLRRITISDFNICYLACNSNNHLSFIRYTFTRCYICVWTETYDTKQNAGLRENPREIT